MSVLYATFVVPGSVRDCGAEQSLATVNDLVLALGDGAERAGIEKLNGNGLTYVACCGMSRDHLDHAIIDFAQEMLRIVRRIRRD